VNVSDRYRGIILVLLLGLQAALSVARAVLTRSRWEWDEVRGLDISPQPDITRLSSALDYARLLVVGLYYVVGLAAGGQPIAAYEARLFAEEVAWFRPLAYLLLLLILTWLSLTLGVLTPEALGNAFASRWSERVTRFSRALHLLLSPLTASGIAMSNTLAGRAGAERLQRTVVITEEEIKTLVTAGEQEGIIEEGAREMIYSIFRLDNMIVREVMVPRIDIVALEVGSGPDHTLNTIVNSGHSRIPVYDETIDNIVGILYAKDLLEYRDLEEIPPLGEILREGHFVPESKHLDNLLREMQEKVIQLAIVVDEYGGVAGLVTMEDVVEEIVGEIQDEYDQEEPEVLVEGEDTYLFDARIPLDDVQELISVSLPLGEADSLGGFLYNQLGHIPQLGERVQYRGVAFEVADLTGRRIRKVRAVKLTMSDEETEEGENHERD
jgi:CBS domain containing-hemolysin-like protein